MTARWQLDSDDAYAQAVAWLDQVAQAQQWSAQWAEYGRELIDSMAPGWFDFGPWETTAEAWWAGLYQLFRDTGEAIEETGQQLPPGWDGLVRLYQSGAGASATAAETEAQQSVVAQLGGAAVMSAEDAAEVAETAARTPWYIWAGLALSAVVVVQNLRPRR